MVLVGYKRDLWRPAGFLQCFDTVGLVIWPVIFRRVISTHKVGQTDVVFGIRSGFIIRFVHTRLQVCLCSGCNLFHPSSHPDRHTHRQFWSAYPLSSVSWANETDPVSAETAIALQSRELSLWPVSWKAVFTDDSDKQPCNRTWIENVTHSVANHSSLQIYTSSVTTRQWYQQ